MGARGDLRHHAAIGRVLGDLAGTTMDSTSAAAVVAPRRTTAAAVSSQLVSMPRTSMEVQWRRGFPATGAVPMHRAGSERLYRCEVSRCNRPCASAARGSKLALAQASMMRARIAAALGADAERIDDPSPITTTGDRIQDRRLLEIGGKGLFTKEIEEALLAAASTRRPLAEGHAGRAAGRPLHRRHPGARGPARRLPQPQGRRIRASLPQGAVLGTASLRRQAHAGARPDLDVINCRGNVDTRLRKLAAGEVDAILLASPG